MTVEERAAQLEEQVATLSIQNLSEDTGPSGYTFSKYSVEEIDVPLDKAAVMDAT